MRFIIDVTLDSESADPTPDDIEAVRANLARAIHRARMEGVITPDDGDLILDEVTVEVAPE